MSTRSGRRYYVPNDRPPTPGEYGLPPTYDPRRFGNRLLQTAAAAAVAPVLFNAMGGMYPFHRNHSISANISSTKAPKTISSRLPKKRKASGSKKTVVHGKSGPSIPRVKKAKVSKALRKGFELSYESRGTVTDPNCIYVGHGLPVAQVVRAMLRLVIKDLFKKHGVDIIDWNHNIPIQNAESYTISLQYFATYSSSALTSFSTSVTSGSWEDLANAWYVAMDTAFTTSLEIPKIHKAILTEGPTGRTIAQIWLDNYNVGIQFQSWLNIQNSTLAGTGLGTNDDQDNDINVNPIRCRKYLGQKDLNAFTPKNRTEASLATWTGFVVNPDYGTFETTSTALGDRLYQKPPLASVFEGTKSSNFVLEPGEIRTSKLVYKKNLKLQALFGKLLRFFVDRTQTKPVIYLGRTAMIAAEHKLKNEGDADVLVSYEHNLKLGLSSTYKNPVQVPIIQILATNN